MFMMLPAKFVAHNIKDSQPSHILVMSLERRIRRQVYDISPNSSGSFDIAFKSGYQYGVRAELFCLIF
jgi:hypothetical protein